MKILRAVHAFGLFGIASLLLLAGCRQLSPGPDLLSITNIEVEVESPTEATVHWTLSHDASGRVEYGLDTLYGSVATSAKGYAQTHSVRLEGLQSSTTYHFRIVAEDRRGQRKVSEDHTFRTQAASEHPQTSWGFRPFDPPANVVEVAPGDNIQAKLRELKLRGGGILRFSEGRFELTEPETVIDFSNLVVEGAGVGKTIIEPGPDGTIWHGFLVPASGDHREIENLVFRNFSMRGYRLDANGNPVQAMTGNLIFLRNNSERNGRIKNVLFENLVLDGPHRTGIAINPSGGNPSRLFEDFTIRNVTVHHAGGRRYLPVWHSNAKGSHGLGVANVKGVLIVNNHLYLNGGFGLDLSGCRYAELVGNTFEENEWTGAFKTPKSDMVYMHHNEIKNNLYWNFTWLTLNGQRMDFENNTLVSTYNGKYKLDPNYADDPEATYKTYFSVRIVEGGGDNGPPGPGPTGTFRELVLKGNRIVGYQDNTVVERRLLVPASQATYIYADEGDDDYEVCTVQYDDDTNYINDLECDPSTTATRINLHRRPANASPDADGVGWTSWGNP